MDIKNLRSLSKKELEGEKDKLSERISKLKKEQWQGKSKDTNAMRKKRKDFARLLTVVKEKEVLEELVSDKSDGDSSESEKHNKKGSNF